MTRRPAVPAVCFGLIRALILVAAVGLLLPAFLVPAAAAPKPTVTVTPVVATANPGKNVTFTGTVSHSSSGATVYIQRKDGSKWVKVASGKVSKAKKFSITARLAVGTHTYRARVAKTKKIAAANSATITGTGTMLRSVSPVHAGDSVLLTAQMPTKVKRKGVLEGNVNGSWKKIKSFTSSKTGVVKVTTWLMTSTDVRFRLPAAKVSKKKYAAWSSPAQAVTVVPAGPSTLDADVQGILDDINAFRASHKRAPVALHNSMSATAKAWSKEMHDTGTFKHRSPLSAGMPSGWKSLAENIAAGQQPTTVVDAWANSSGHRANMLGSSFTHIGIGYYSGSKGYKRYYTTIFAAY